MNKYEDDAVVDDKTLENCRRADVLNPTMPHHSMQGLSMTHMARPGRSSGRGPHTDFLES